MGVTAAALCLATNIYFEARNQPLAGQIAVSNVVMNRVQDPRYPDNVCGVVHQAKVDYRGHPKRNQCQFSWYCDGKSDKPTNSAAWGESLQLAQHILDGKYWDLTEGALFYHSIKVLPNWAERMEQTVRINDHLFYKIPK